MKQDVRDALDAIVRCDAIDEAYIIAEQAGWRELFPGCIYKSDGEESKMALDATVARQIIKQAIKDETYGGAEPEDDATCIKEADQLVEMAEQAWAQYIRGSEVETILKLANAMPNGDEPKSESEPTPPSEPQGESETADDDGDGEGAPEIPALEADLDPELAKVEPWEGYGEDRVSDITAGINAAVEDPEYDVIALISHVWAYESSHKARVRVLKHIKQVWEQANGGSGEQTSPKEADARTGGEAERHARAADAETPPTTAQAAGDQESGDDGSTEGEEPESHAPAEPEPETRQPAGEARTERSEPSSESPPKDQGGRFDRGTAKSFGEDKNPAYRALIEGVERELAAERIHVPKRPGEDVPDLPWRWSEISDSDLHDFHMQYAAAAFYTQYVVTRNDRIAMHCREAADELHRELLNNATKYDEKGKPIPVTILEAQIEGDPNIKSWRKRQRKHTEMAMAAKRELDGYHKQVEALSRLESMRHQSWERARR